MLWFLRLALLWLLPRLGKDPEKIRELVLECLALRQQNAILMRSGRRPRLKAPDRAFWVLLSWNWSRWKDLCLLVKPATVIRWHRDAFRVFWRWRSRKKGNPGRPQLEQNLRALIRRMTQENPTWGAPRIHGELLKLGFSLSERSVLRWMPRRPFDPKRAQSWRTFLANHREAMCAMDFMVVPTWTFQTLYVLVIVDHGRRIVRHLNVTSHPTAAWVRQQLREAFPFDEIPKYLLFDNDAIFAATKGFVAAMGITPTQTSLHSPWQNGICERIIGTLRRDLLDHVIALDEAHLRRLLKEYLRYYHHDRTHLTLGKDSPRGRPVNQRSDEATKVMALPKCGGLHHRYRWVDAA